MFAVKISGKSRGELERIRRGPREKPTVSAYNILFYGRAKNVYRWTARAPVAAPPTDVRKVSVKHARSMHILWSHAGRSDLSGVRHPTFFYISRMLSRANGKFFRSLHSYIVYTTALHRDVVYGDVAAKKNLIVNFLFREKSMQINFRFSKKEIRSN